MPQDPGRAPSWHRSASRLVVTFIVLVVVTVVTGATWSWLIAPAVGWTVASGTYCLWVAVFVLRMDAVATAEHATREDPTRPVAHTLLILASVASFGAIGLLLLESGQVRGPTAVALGAAALITVAASWFLIQILFTLRYAETYYAAGSTGIDFNQTDPPRYHDFAYLAFTLGMTYQVSDTALTSTRMRRQALRHALLSFVWGVVVLATSLNLVVNLAS
ncbi:DUF1345 domain-containing protein [Microbacterium lushaniae]|uniref:DUF1345 domain-containing protein n=1 Tax=Microbacterium lushaniae TaxID=2614639 RepID=A0A5J6L7C7_9MICO|nr:DUF1345 domain-containing protein [Microbacterium lushaniae]QEW04355.1 DUF1345 domain-containing protein [Microbacterium lushaniae]